MRGRRRVFWAVLGRARAALPDPARPLALCASALGALAIAGCGGGTRQDANEKSASYEVKILAARFPARQAVSRQTRMVLRVRNAGTSTVPNLAITVDSFNYASNFPELADDKRPLWVIEQGPGAIAKPPVSTQEISPPGGGQTNYVNTWALGPLAAGRTQEFTWKVVPVKPGVHTVTYTVAAGLGGKARAQLASGGAVTGRFRIDVAGRPPSTYVDPSTGKVRPGVYPASPAAP